MYEVLCGIVDPDHISVNELMSKHTSFRIGGACKYFVTPDSIQQIQQLITACVSHGIPYFILGNGTNLLVSDSGFDGVVICINDNLSDMHIHDNTITAQAGVNLILMARAAAAARLSGLEFAAGLPGTVGGGVIMNAGAYGGDISSVIKKAKLMDETGRIFELSKDELQLGYRTSLPSIRNWIVLEAVFELIPGTSAAIDATMKALNKKRREKQPLEYPSAGSSFKRPEGYYAGKLISDSGLSGFCIGDACVSPKHNGFIINTGSASASDVYKLIKHIQAEVKAKSGICLIPEIKFLGSFS